MNADRRFRGWQERLRVSLRQWDESGQDDGALLRGVPLAEAEQWSAERGPQLSTAERTYIEASAADQSARLARRTALEQRSRHRLRALVGVLAVGITVTLGLTALATRAQGASEANAREARRSAVVARSRELLAGGQGDLALALALEAVADGRAPPDAQLALSEAAYAAGTRRLMENRSIKLAISPDGSQLLSADYKDVSQWDMATGRLVRHLVGHHEAVDSVAFSADGRLAVSSSDDANGPTPDKALIVWDMATGQAVQSFAGHTNWVMSTALSPDSRRVLSASLDGTIRLWDRASGQELEQYPMKTGLIRDIAFLANGRRAVAHVPGGVAVVFDLDSGRELFQFPAPIAADPEVGADRMVDLTLDPAGRRVAASFYRDGARVWDADSGDEIGSLKAVMDQVAFLPDPRYLLATGASRTGLSMWDITQGSAVQRYVGHESEVVDIVTSADGLAAASGDSDAIRIWNLWGSALTGRLTSHEGAVTSVTVSPDGRRMLSASFDGWARLWDLTTGKQLRRFGPHAARVRSADLSPDGATVATAAEDGPVMLWDVASGRPRHMLRLVWGSQSVAFSADGRSVLTNSFDGMARVWDVETGAELRRYTRTGTVREGLFKEMPRSVGNSGNTGAFQAIFGPGGDTIIGAASSMDPGVDHVAVMWDEAGHVLRIFRGHTNQIYGMALSRDERTLVTSSFDSTVRWWDVASGEELRRREFDAMVMSQAFSPDGRWLLVGTGAGDLFLMTADGAEILRHYDASVGQEIDTVAFSPDGRSFFSGSTDGVIRQWEVHPTIEELLAWIPERRYIPELTCDQRLRFETERQCGPDGAPPPAAVAPKSDPPAEPSSPSRPATAPAGTAVRTTSPRPTPAEMASAREIGRIELEAGPGVLRSNFGLAVAPDGTRALVGTDRGLRMYDLGARVPDWKSEGDSLVVVPAMAVGADGRTAVTGSESNNELATWDTETGEQLQTLDVGAAVYCLSLSPDSRRVAYGTLAGLGLWTPGTSNWDQVDDAIDGVTAVTFSPHGRTLLTGGPDGRPRLWDVSAAGPPKPLRSFGGEEPAHGDFIRTVAFSPDGGTAVTGDNGAMVWWDVASGTATERVTDHLGVYFVSFSPDGKYLLVSTEDAVIRVWDVATREVVRELRGHTGVRTPATFTAGACRVVSAGDDGRLIVWDTGLCGPMEP
jgi:WD40 repeat protein